MNQAKRLAGINLALVEDFHLFPEGLGTLSDHLVLSAGYRDQIVEPVPINFLGYVSPIAPFTILTKLSPAALAAFKVVPATT